MEGGHIRHVRDVGSRLRLLRLKLVPHDIRAKERSGTLPIHLNVLVSISGPYRVFPELKNNITERPEKHPRAVRVIATSPSQNRHVLLVASSVASSLQLGDHEIEKLHLVVAPKGIGDLPDDASQLRTLQFTSVVSGFPGLRSLFLHVVLLRTVFDVGWIDVSLPQLEELHAVECGPWALELLRRFEMPSLNTLAISISRYETFEGFESFVMLRPLAAIRHLILYAMKGDHIRPILLIAPSVEFLALSYHRGAWSVEDIGLANAAFLPCLTTLSLRVPEMKMLEARKVVESRLGILQHVDLVASVGEGSGLDMDHATNEGWVREHVELNIRPANEMELGPVVRRMIDGY